MASSLADAPRPTRGFVSQPLRVRGGVTSHSSGSAPGPRRYPLGDRGLAIVLGLLFLASWIAQFVFELIVVRSDAHERGDTFAWADFWPEFWQSTMENWQSEFLQLLTFVMLTTYLVYRGSHESKDQDDEVFAMLQRIDSRLGDLERRAGEREPRP
jgi:hypothetical protein